MLKWAVGGGDQPPGGGERRSVNTPTSRHSLNYRQSLRKTAEKFHLLPSTEAQQPIKRAVIRNLNIHIEEGKENADEVEEATQEKRPRDRSLSLLRRLKSFGQVNEKTTNGRTSLSHITDKSTNSRGPLGDVTNQSPVPSPRSGPKLTPARSRSRTRRTFAKLKTPVETEVKSDTGKAKCSNCNSTPRRRIPKRTPKRRKQQQPEYNNISPLKPSDLCIDYSPDFSDSLLALRKRLEESFPSTTSLDNPLYYSIKPNNNNIQDNPLYMCINTSVSPIANKMSTLKLNNSPQELKISPVTPITTSKVNDFTDPRSLEITVKNNQNKIELKPIENQNDISNNDNESLLQSTLINTSITNTSRNEPIIIKTRLRRYSETIESKTHIINRRRRYSDSIKTSQTQLLLQALLKPDISPIKSEDNNIELLSDLQNNSHDNTSIKQSNLSMEVCAILQDNFKPPYYQQTVIPYLKNHDLPQRFNTLPTPRLTPDLISSCWQARNSVSSVSELSTLGETWDSHRLHTILMQQNKATINSIPTMQDIDTPPILETKSLLDLNNTIKNNDFGTPLSEHFDKKIKNAKILDLARPLNNNQNIDILQIIDSVLNPAKDNIITDTKVTVVKKFESAINVETPNIGASYSQDTMMTSEITESPLAMVDKRSRSRRCLLYASPSVRVQPGLTPCRNKKRKKSRSSHPSRGEVRLALYNNSGLLTIHVISATNLPQRDQNRPASAFVKMCILPRRVGGENSSQSQQGEVHRTNVRRPAPGPGGSPVYRFDQKFSLEVQDIEDKSEARVLVSVWLRPRAEKHRKSECVGCMSFGVQDVLENEVRGTFLVLSPSAGRTQYVTARNSGLSTGLSRTSSVMAEQSDSSVDDTRDTDTPRRLDRRRSAYRKSHPSSSANEDSTFLRHLELEPTPESGAPSTATGRTPFTTTRKLNRKPGSGFGFSVAWTQPPRVERVEAGLPADKAGLRPGDYIIFVESHNVVTMPEEEILSLIRLSNNHLTLEVYRRTTPNGVVLQPTASSPAPQPPPAQRRSASVTDCSAATSLDLRRRLQLPQVAFTTEHIDILSQGGLTADEARKRAIYQLLQRLQNFALVTHFGVERFLVPLSDRKDLLTSQEHLTLFQNMEELVMLTEEVLEQLVGDEGENHGSILGRVYLNKIQALTNAYRKYCMGLKRADCLLAQQSSSPEFMRVTSEPPIPKRRPDLTTFIHKPLEHYRETLKLLQTVLKNSKVNDEEYAALSKVVQALQTTYRDITANSGLMEPDGDGRLLLSLQDLESRLVFTKCKPFVLSTGGRQWIFGGDLSRVDGRTLRPFWALLFTDLLLLAKVSRDRVLFVTDEPISLLDVTQACFSVKKKDTEFRLVVDAAPHSPAEVPGAKPVKSKHRRRSVAFRAPTPELKAVWQNLLQRQIIYLNTVRGGTPNASPLDSPAEQPSLTTADSPSRLQLGPAVTGSQKHLDQLIEQKCRLLGKSGVHKGSALHLQQWMTGQLGAGHANSPVSPEEPEPEIWSPGTLRKRGEQLMSGGIIGRTESRCEEYEMSSPDPERSNSRSTDDSLITVKSGGIALYKKLEATIEAPKTSTVIEKVEKPKNITITSTTTVVETKTVSSISSAPVLSSKITPTPTVTVNPKTSPVTSVAMCKDCLEKCAGQHCPSSHRIPPKTLPEVKPQADSSSDYDSEEGDRWEPLPSELGITLNRDPFYPQDDHHSKLPTIAVLPPTPSETLSLAGSMSGSQKTFEWDATDDLVAAAEACAMPDEDDDDSDEMERAGPNEVGEPPYRSLSNSNLRKYGTLTSLENVENANDETTDAADESDDDEQYIEESPNESFATVRFERSEISESVTTASSTSDRSALVQIDAMHQSLKGWSSRHGTTVAEKAKIFEQISEQSKGNHVSIERFLPNPLASGIPPIGVFSIPRTISSSIFVPGNDQPTPPKTPTNTPPKALPRVNKPINSKNEPTMPRTVASLSKEHHNKPSIPTPATVPQPLVRHTVVMGTCATLKSKAPAVPVRSKIYSSFKSAKAAAPPPPIPNKPLELTTTARPKSPPEISTSAAAAAAIAAANQVGSPDSSVSDKDEWGTPEGNDPDDTEEELSSTQDIVSLFPCVGSDQLPGQRSWSPDEDDQLTTLLSAPPRVFPRRRLEPLYEEEDGMETQRPRPRLLSDSSSSGGSTPEHPKVAPRRGCMVPGQGSWADVCADSEIIPAQGAGRGNLLKTTGELDMKEQTHRGSSGLLQRLKLASSRRRGWGGIEQAKITSPRNSTQNKILGGLLGNNRSEDNNGNPGARGLLRIFGNNNNNNNNAANNTVNNKEGTTARLDQDKILDRRFWKQLKRRRGSINNSSNPPIAV